MMEPMPTADTRLVLIRHGESKVTVERVIGGHRTCSGLSELGRRQAERLRTRLSETGELAGSVLYSSNFPRAVETAEIVASAISDEPVRIEPGFVEHDPGPDLDGLPFDEYVERYGSPDWSGDPHHDVFPGGETIAEFHLRVGSTLRRVVDLHRGRRIVVACHGGVVDAVFRHLLGTSPTGGFDIWTTNTSLTEFVLPDTGGEAGSDRPTRVRLVRYNDAAHLAGLPTSTP